MSPSKSRREILLKGIRSYTTPYELERALKSGARDLFEDGFSRVVLEGFLDWAQLECRNGNRIYGFGEWCVEGYLSALAIRRGNETAEKSGD